MKVAINIFEKKIKDKDVIWLLKEIIQVTMYPLDYL